MTAGLPLVSIVTPSLDQGRFIERAILSVLEQDYPSTEHIVVDGGSSDDTLQILARYPRLRWISEPDRGQADALVKGFRIARGEILAWLNSDDYYLPGAFRSAVEAFAETGAGLVYGRCVVVDEDGETLEEAKDGHEFELRRELEWGTKVPQPAAFFTRTAFEQSGGLDPRYRYAMDYDLWLRIATRFPVRHVPATLAAFRVHPESKTVSENERFWPEVRRISRRNGGPLLSWMYLERQRRLHPHLAPWLFRLRHVRDRLLEGRGAT